MFVIVRWDDQDAITRYNLHIRITKQSQRSSDTQPLISVCSRVITRKWAADFREISDTRQYRHVYVVRWGVKDAITHNLPRMHNVNLKKKHIL